MTGHVLVIGPPLAGKTTWVRQNAQAGDAVYDFDLVHAAVSLRESYDHDPALRGHVLAMRDALFGQLAQPGSVRGWVISTSPKRDRVQAQIEQLDAQVMPLLISREEAHRRADEAKRPAVWHEYIDRWFARNDWTPADFTGRLYAAGEQAPAPLIERVRSRRSAMRGADGVERRDMALPVDLRVNAETGAPVVEGYAAVFDSLSETLFEWDNGRFREKVTPGAFKRSLNAQNIPLLVEHAQLPLATTGAGTLHLAEDAHGLRFESELEPSDPDVQRLVPKMRRGDLNRCSFGFIPVRQSWDNQARPRVRTLHEVKLVDVSIVARPAYPATEAKVRKELADAGLDAELIAEVLVRVRQGLPLDADDMAIMRQLAEMSQRHLSDSTTTPEADPGQAHSADDAYPVANSTTGPDSKVHPLAWYQERLARMRA